MVEEILINVVQEAAGDGESLAELVDPYEEVFGVKLFPPSIIEDKVAAKAAEMGIDLEEKSPEVEAFKKEYTDFYEAEYKEYLEDALKKFDGDLTDLIREIEHDIATGNVSNTAATRGFLEQLHAYQARIDEARWLLEHYDLASGEIVYYEPTINDRGEEEWIERRAPYNRQVLLSEAYWRFSGRVTISVPDFEKRLVV